jgi:hypothetical protein
VLLAFAVGVGCRPSPTRAPHEHRRPTYATEIATNVSGDVAHVFAALAQSHRDAPTILDERLCVVARELAEHTTSSDTFDVVDVEMLAREAGSVLYPTLAVAVQPSGNGWADGIIASTPGRGPLAIGIGQAEDGLVVIVLARDTVHLSTPVARSGATEFELELRPSFDAFTPELLVVTEAGVRRESVRALGNGRFVAERSAGFDGTLTAIVGRGVERAGIGSRSNQEELLAALRFEGAPDLGAVEDSDLARSIAKLRSSWGKPEVAISAAAATPCGPTVLTIDSVQVMLDQQCVAWASSGDDVSRWRALLVNPLALEAVTSDRWHVAEVRRDPTTTSVRLARRFEDVAVEEAHVRVRAVVQQRWPNIRHDAAADPATIELAQAWASTPLSHDSIAAAADVTAARAAAWSTEPRWFRLAVTEQDLARVLDAVPADVTPTVYTLGVGRGPGEQGEPRYYVVLLLALP